MSREKRAEPAMMKNLKRVEAMSIGKSLTITEVQFNGQDLRTNGRMDLGPEKRELR